MEPISQDRSVIVSIATPRWLKANWIFLRCRYTPRHGRSKWHRSFTLLRQTRQARPEACEIAIVLRPTPHVTGSVWCGLEPLFRQIMDSLSDDSIGALLRTFPLNRVLAHPDLSDQERLNRFLRLSKWGVGPYRHQGSPRFTRRSFRGGLSFHGASSSEVDRHAVIPFVTREFVEQILALVHRNLCGPRFRPCSWIGDRVLVEQRLRVHPREPFDQRLVLARSESRPPDLRMFPVEIRGLDYQCLVFPAAARISHPLPNPGSLSLRTGPRNSLNVCP